LHSVEIWTLRKVDHKYLGHLKCAAGEGWRRSVGPNVRNEQIFKKVREKRNITQRIQWRKVSCIVTYCAGTAL